MRWLVLTGYMGAGKTAVGRRWRRAWAGRSPTPTGRSSAAPGWRSPEIFSRRGEVWFRRTEETVIREVLEGEPGVLALGGGALESARTRSLVGRVADVVWLRASVDVAWARVEGSDRPLAGDRERFARRAVAREAGYREAAALEVDADDPADEVAARVAAWAQRGARAAR